MHELLAWPRRVAEAAVEAAMQSTGLDVARLTELRRKLREARSAAAIQTRRGEGYRLVPSGTERS